jgi:SAM-dependent methyltransferase
MSTEPVASAFTGTASYYASYRPPYPDELLSRLRLAAGTTGNGVLVDLACGPGRIAIPMASHFRRVVAIDVEPEMIAVGKLSATRCGETNIDWRVTPAEQLELPPASVELVTIGEAFHRLDQSRVLELVKDWLIAGGFLATLGGEPVWSGSEPWKRVLVDVANKWTSLKLGDPNVAEWGGPRDVLRAAGWHVTEFQTHVETVWTTDSLVGFMLSTSFASRAALRERAAPFEADLRRELLEFAPNDQFPARQRFGFTLATRRVGVW